MQELVIIAQSDSMHIVKLNEKGRELAFAGDFDASEKIFLSILEMDTNSVLARNNLGNVYKITGRYNDALEMLFEAEALVIEKCGQHCSELSPIYMNVGLIYNMKQDYQLALQYLQYSKRLLQSSNQISVLYSSIFNNIGNVYFGMQEWRKALDSYLEGVAIKKEYNFGGLDVSYSNCASAYEKLGKPDSARMFYDYSIKAKISRYGPENYSLTGVYNNYGILLMKLGEYDLAFQYLNDALLIAQNSYISKHPVISECHKYLASWYMETGSPRKALEHFSEAVNMAIYGEWTDPGGDEISEDKIISSPVLLGALMGKADALGMIYGVSGRMEDLKAAAETQELANLLAGQMRAGFLSQESKLFITEYAHTGYEKAMYWNFLLYEQSGDQACAANLFSNAEKGKSAVLLASMQEMENKRDYGVKDEIRNMEQELKFESDLYKKKLYEEYQRIAPDSAKLAIWERKLLSLSQQLDSLNEIIINEYPLYASKYDNQVISLEQVRNNIGSGEALIEYALTDSLLYIFAISAEGFTIRQIAVCPDFHEHLDVLGFFLRDNEFTNTNFNDFLAYTRSAYALYGFLIEPVLGQISGKDLIIVPDGKLGYIPFEALLTDTSHYETMVFRDLPYMIHDHNISYSYSATIYFSKSRMKKQARNGLLAFAPTYDHVSDIRSEKFPAFRDYDTYLVPLRFISSEIENICGLFACTRYEDYQATEEVFREQAPHFDILHLAMHTLINDENPMYSQLVFTLNNDTIEDRDGLLNTYEIYNMKLNARMAVLSACNTGYGQLRRGEGVMSLARGFIFAGVPSIIMTLWAVEDQSGSMLMTNFYGKLAGGMKIVGALRDSKLEYLRNTDHLGAHPYLWSGYVGIGTNQAILAPVGGVMKYIFSGFAAMVLLALMIILLNKKKKAKKNTP
jgi:CHAT domain-containing protein